MASLLGRVTIYRLANVAPTVNAMFDATAVGRLAESGMDVELVQLATAPGILWYGEHPTTDTSWSASLSRLSGVPLGLTRHDSEALLIVAVGDHVYAVGFGQGYRSIIDAVEPGFGLRCALRLIDPSKVQDLVRCAMGGVPRQDSTFVPSGIPIEGIGMAAHAELVKKLGGLLQARDLGLAHRETVSIAGADGLRLPMPVGQEEFLALLYRLNEISERPVPRDFAPLDAIQPVFAADLRAQLDLLLGAGLRGQGEVSVQTVIPASLSDRRDEAGSYRIKIGSVAIVREELDLTAVRQRCDVEHRLDPVTALRAGRIDLCADNDGKESLGYAPASHWIEASASIGSRIFQLSDDKWYECGTAYVASIRHRVEELITKTPEIEMPPWWPDEEEKDYNIRLQDHFGREKFVCLDRRCFRTSQHRRGRGLEVCDGFTDRHTLIHVKAAAGSEPLSHQFNQALVSVQALLFQPEAREKLSAKVAEYSGGLLSVPRNFRPKKVVLAILLKGKELTPDSLYPFAQVALVAMADALQAQGVSVEVVGIPADHSYGATNAA